MADLRATPAFELPHDLVQCAVHVSRSRTQREVVIEALQEYICYHEEEQQRVAAVENGFALLTSGDLDPPPGLGVALTCLLDISVWNRQARASALLPPRRDRARRHRAARSAALSTE